MQPTRAQRLAATRTAHRLVRRVRETWAKAQALEAEASRIGLWWRSGSSRWRTDAEGWCTTTVKGRLFFHPPDVPVRVWAVSIQPAGVIWAEATVTKITEQNVMVRYAGETARLNRHDLWRWWAFWRGVQFVSSRTGRIAAGLDELWQERYGGAAGGVPPVLQMPLANALALLGLPADADYTREEVLAAFRVAVKKVHPDVGGTAEQFHQLVEARDRLLAALGTSAPAPKPPAYAPSGQRVIYRRQSLRQNRLGISRTRQIPGR